MDDAHARDLLLSERRRLETIREDISTDGLIVDSDEQEVAEGADGQHPGDVGTQVADASRDIGLLEQVEHELEDVESALRRIDEGTYGLCQICGRPIPDERLEANPTATYDVEHEPPAEPNPLR